MPETNTTQTLPDVPVDNPDRMSPYVHDLLQATEQNLPGFVVRRENIHVFNGRSRAQVVGDHVLDVLQRSGQWGTQRLPQHIRPTIYTPDHLDGIAYGRHFVQVHAMGTEGPHAAADLTVRRLNPYTQMQVKEHIGSMEDNPESYATSTFVTDLPESVLLYSPIVGRYRAFLRPGDAMVFRNGFSGRQVLSGTDKLFTTHSFQSVDEQGEYVNAERQATVSVIDTRQPASR